MAIVLSDKKAIVLKVKDRDRFTEIFPKYHKIDYDGMPLLALPHTIDTMRVLRNMGVKTTNCEVLKHRYTAPLIKGRYNPMWHQIETAAFLSEHPRAFCLNQPRTGKTASVVMAVDFLRQQRTINSVLVVAPRSCLRDVWEAEVFGLVPSMSVAVLHGTKAQRQALLKRDYAMYVINPDGLKVIRSELAEAVKSGRINVIVFDECTDFANSRSERWKAAEEISRYCDYVWGLTGTPGGPEEVYGQAKLIVPKNVTMSFTTWRDRTMYQLRQHKWAPRDDYLEKIDKLLQPSICFKKDEIMDLPPIQQFDREAPLSKAQKDVFDRMLKHMVSVQDNITAVNAGVLTSKLLQIATGSVKTDDGEAITFDIEPRLTELRKIISETEFKVVVFAPFSATLDKLKEELGKYHTCEIVDGRVTGAAREDIFHRFREHKDPHVLLCHPRTTSFGLELSVADTIVFWGPPLNGAFVYQQAIERINSVLQKSKTPAIIHLHSTYIERRLFKSIRDGVEINTQVLELFKEIITHDN